MEISQILEKLQALDVGIPSNLLIIGWLLIKGYKHLSAINFSQAFEMEEAIVKKCEERCEEIAKAFSADRCLYWQAANGEKFMNFWPKKKLVAMAEYFAPETGLTSFKTEFSEVSTMRFDRNLKALLSGSAIVQSGRSQSVIVNYGKENADIEIFKGAIFVADEAPFADEVSNINIKYGWRSLAACCCTDRRGKLIGFLVIGFINPQQHGSVNIELFKDQGRTFYKSIYNVTSRYNLSNRILRAVFNKLRLL